MIDRMQTRDFLESINSQYHFEKKFTVVKVGFFSQCFHALVMFHYDLSASLPIRILAYDLLKFLSLSDQESLDSMLSMSFSGLNIVTFELVSMLGTVLLLI